MIITNIYKDVSYVIIIIHQQKRKYRVPCVNKNIYAKKILQIPQIVLSYSAFKINRYKLNTWNYMPFLYHYCIIYRWFWLQLLLFFFSLSLYVNVFRRAITLTLTKERMKLNKKISLCSVIYIRIVFFCSYLKQYRPTATRSS